MGQVKLRGGVWWVRYYRNGKRYEESSGSATKDVARDLLKKREGAHANGIPVTPQMARLTFDAAVADVMNDYRINGKTSVDCVERRIRLHLTPFFGGMRMQDITTTQLREFIVQRQALAKHDNGTETPGASHAEINRELAIVKRAFRLAIQAGSLQHVPHVPHLQENNVRSGFFEREQFTAVSRHLPADLRPILMLGYYSGWRRSEITDLQWRQVDLQAGIVRLDPGTTKNKDGRLFPFKHLPDVDKMFRAQRKLTDAAQKASGKIIPWVFHRDGEPIQRFRKAWASACKAAGCPGRVFHDLRRTAVRNLVRAGVPEKQAMLLTGHKTRSVFDRYDIVNEADLHNAIARLAEDRKTTKALGRHVAGTRAGKGTR